jgi:hypothetical protein
MESSFIDPGIGTAPKPDAGPSQGQVPQVALDESRQIVACFRRNRPAVAMREERKCSADPAPLPQCKEKPPFALLLSTF